MIRIFGALELAHLASLSERAAPLLTLAADKINALCAEEECHAQIIRGRASLEAQLEIWKVGRVLLPGRDPRLEASWRVQDPGLVRTRTLSSSHLDGDALDVALLDDRDDAWLAGGGRPDPRWGKIIRTVADELGLVWGGRFTVRNAKTGKAEPWFDGAHLQHPAWVHPSKRT